LSPTTPQNDAGCRIEPPVSVPSESGAIGWHLIARGGDMTARVHPAMRLGVLPSGDLSFEERVAMCHEYFGGKAIFSADAPLYAIHFEDVVEAVHHALTNDLDGTFNVCDNDNLPATNQRVFDAICAAKGLSPLEFLDQIKAPLKKISAQKLYDTGYRVSHPDPNASLFETGEA
jgi:hypothetical protein